LKTIKDPWIRYNAMKNFGEQFNLRETANLKFEAGRPLLTSAGDDHADENQSSSDYFRDSQDLPEQKSAQRQHQGKY
jgi:hypothetical protein